MRGWGGEKEAYEAASRLCHLCSFLLILAYNGGDADGNDGKYDVCCRSDSGLNPCKKILQPTLKFRHPCC